MNPEDSIPPQTEGIEVNVEDSVVCESASEARHFFTIVKQRLLDVNQWENIAGTLSAGFCLTNEQGQPIDTIPRAGNYFKIDIPAPGIITGEGFDWVRVEAIKEEATNDEEYLLMQVRPAPSPLNDNKDVAHFYTGDATSNFIVKRTANKVTAGVYGRNEKPNVKSDTLLDKARNVIVGSGAVTGFAKLQWKALVSGLLKKKQAD